MYTEGYINSLQDFVRQTIEQDLNSYSLKFLTRHVSPFENYIVTPLKFHMKWGKEFELIELDEPREIYNHRFMREFRIDANLEIKSEDNAAIITTDFSGHFLCEAFVNFIELKFTFEVFDEEKRFLKEFNRKVIEASKKHGIRAFDEESLIIDGKGISLYFTDITRKLRTNPFATPFQDFNTLHDIIRCSQDIRFIISQVLLYKPYVTNYLQGKTSWQGKMLFRYNPTMFDKRFFMNCSLAIELLYNFWDKIGDLLNYCFGVITRPNVYFASVVNKIPSTYHSSSNYDWLKNFVDSDFTTLLDTRNKIVHYTAIESKFFENWIDNHNNESEIIKLQAEKEQLIPFLLLHNKHMLVGFEKATKLIDEIA